MAYPASITSFQDPSGTSPLATGPDHAALHTSTNDTLEALQNTLGTTNGTAVLRYFSANEYPVRYQGTALSGTILGTMTLNHAVLGTATLVGALLTSPTITTPFIDGGTLLSPIIGTPSITGGTITGAVFSGALNNVTLGSPTINSGTANGLTLAGGISLASNGSITQTGTADHITLTPGASKLVRTATRYQAGTTNSHQGSVVTQHGWGYMEGAGGTAIPNLFTKAVTFPDAFGTLLSLHISSIGFKNSSGAPTSITDFSDNPGVRQAAGAVAVGTAGFTAQHTTDGGVNADRWVGFSWIAFGIIP